MVQRKQKKERTKIIRKINKETKSIELKAVVIKKERSRIRIRDNPMSVISLFQKKLASQVKKKSGSMVSLVYF